MAMASPHVTTEVVMKDEFPDLARKYRVVQIPHTVINDRIEFIGLAPENYIIDKILSLNEPLATVEGVLK